LKDADFTYIWELTMLDNYLLWNGEEIEEVSYLDISLPKQ